MGNFRGQCVIQLNGQAIVILSNGIEINRWPYNCIRQFRAEDESGKFSFVSGRRGPYGVAEYNFVLNSDLLMDLQGALTEFTGAQFSAVAPGSDPEQQPLQPQEPLPPYPPPMSHYPSVNNSYIMSDPRHRGSLGGVAGGRNNSSSSDLYPDSAFGSPDRFQQPPKLPPRPPDYTNTSLTDHTRSSSSLLASSADETSLRSTLHRSRTYNSASSIASQEPPYSAPRPALPPRHEGREVSPETRVAISTSYEQTQLTNQQQQQQPAVPVPVPKKKSFFNRHKTDK